MMRIFRICPVLRFCVKLGTTRNTTLARLGTVPVGYPATVHLVTRVAAQRIIVSPVFADITTVTAE